MKTFVFNTSVLWNVLKLSVWLIYGKLVIISHNLKIKDFCLFLTAVITKYCKVHGLKQHKFILSQFWKLKVHNQGDGKAVLPLKSVVMNPSLPLPNFLWFYICLWCFLVCGDHTSISASVFTYCSSFLCLCSLSSFYKDTSHIG